MRRLVLLLFSAVVLGCVTATPADEPWVALTTAHFDIASALSTEKTLALGRDLELFRASAELLAGVPFTTSPRVRVLAFDDRAPSRPFSRPGVTGAAFESGYLLESLAGATLVLRSGGGWRADATTDLRHELAHFWLRNTGGLDLPPWYDAGMAWLVASTEVDPPVATVGRIPESQLRVLRSSDWVPIREVLDAEDVSRWPAARRRSFRAEAWALVHDLHFTGVAPDRVGGQLAEILEGDDAALARLRADLEPALAEIDERLSMVEYQDRWRGIEIHDPSPPFKAKTRSIDRPGAFAALGWLALDIDRVPLAARHFEAVLRVAPEHAEALAGMVEVEMRRENWDAASSHMGRALASAAENPRVCLAAARLALARNQAGEARAHLDDCQNTAASERSALYGATYVIEGEPAEAARAPLDHAQEALPSSLAIRLLHAEQRRRVGLRASAETLARFVLAHSHDASLRARAEALLEEL